MGYDGALNVVGIHGVGGIWGALTVLISVVFGFIGAFVILKLVDGLMGLRVSDKEERMGLDLSQHDERTYS
jgi:Amt family ammonium transporter